MSTSEAVIVTEIKGTNDTAGVDKAFDPNSKVRVDIAVLQWDKPSKPHCHIFLRNDPTIVAKILAAQETWFEDDPFDALICINAPNCRAEDVFITLAKVLPITRSQSA